MTTKHLSKNYNKNNLIDIQSRYTSLVENLKIGVYRNTAGPKGHFLEANTALVNMFGAKSKEELMKVCVSDLYQNPKERNSFVKEILRKGEIKDKQINLVGLKGRKFIGSVSAVMKKDANGSIYFDGFVEDISKRKKMEQQLILDKKNLENRVKERTKALHMLNIKQAKEIVIRSKVQNILITNNEELEKTKKALLNVMEDFEKARSIILREKIKDEAILASIGDGVIVVDKDMKIVISNKAAEKNMGWSRQEMWGKPWQQIIDLKTSDNIQVPIKESPLYLAISNGSKSTSINYLYTRKNATTFPVAVTVSPVVLNKKIIGAILVFRDITKEKQIDKAKTEFVSLASHQLRTPLGIMKWYLEALEKEDCFMKAPLQARNYFYEIQKSNERVLSLVRELLSVSRIDQRRIKDFPKLTDVKTVLKEVVRQLQIIAHKKNIKLRLSIINGNIPLINIDPLRLHETVENLIGNAIEYTGAGGTVKIKLQKIKHNVSISVRDTGMGISEGDRKNLFTKFFRSEEAIKNNPEGSGLGLYVVKSYVEGWGGRVDVDSTYGKGSVFAISLPIKENIKGGELK